MCISYMSRPVVSVYTYIQKTWKRDPENVEAGSGISEKRGSSADQMGGCGWTRFLSEADLNLTGSEEVFLGAFREVQGFFRELRNNYDRMAFLFLIWDVGKTWKCVSSRMAQNLVYTKNVEAKVLGTYMKLTGVRYTGAISNAQSDASACY